jgi:Transglycosylase SLT domain/D-alanyl-D-alanine carboxypeptidase
VAVAFDRMAAAARRAGLGLLVVSGYRSDAEQAELFARHPDPRWVAPPGHSLHRCATELDLGPSSAYGWLAANAGRFGFVRRYSWEAWHFGYSAGPPPCSQAGNAVPVGGPLGDEEGLGRSSGLPDFLPAPYWAPLLRSASRWNVSPGLLAAQLEAESGFNPRAVSPAGALGIAQFMPATARSYGLRDPFDPVASIDAQAHLMSDLLRRFHSVPLALAAYNAGSGAVAACGCVPSYPETRAYVARILALANGAGMLLTPPLEVRLLR